MMRRIVIIGGGPGGLAAAMLLSRFDAEVTLIERAPAIGGRCASIHAEGFTFDTGPTFFFFPEALEEVFAACGADLHEEVELIRLDPQYRLQFEDGLSIDATGDIPRMQAQLAAIDPHDAANLPRFLRDNRAKFESFRPVFRRAFHSPFALLSPDVIRALPKLRPHRTLDRDLAQYFRDPRIRLAFSFQSKYLGMSPFRCPSLFSIISALEYDFGVFHPRGGCGALMAAMARVARRLGVRIHTGEAAEELVMRGRRAVGVRTARDTYDADAVVLNADFAHAIKRLIPDRLRRRWTDAKLERKKFSCSTFMLYLGIDGRIDALPHHTIYLAEGYARNMREIEQGHVLSDNPSFYVQNAAITDPSLAPRGCSTLYVLIPVPHRSPHIDWSDVAPYRARVFAHLRKLGVDDIERRIRVERVITPRDWEEGHAIHRGATFSLQHSLDQMLHRRPHNRFEDVDGVYLVGGGTHPGSGLPVIFQSARISTDLMERDLGLVARPSAFTAPMLDAMPAAAS